jgi:hypothetical protein
MRKPKNARLTMTFPTGGNMNEISAAIDNELIGGISLEEAQEMGLLEDDLKEEAIELGGEGIDG